MERNTAVTEQTETIIQGLLNKSSPSKTGIFVK